MQPTDSRLSGFSINLLTLMYHRGVAGPDGNSREMLDAHFAHISRHYECVLPGEPLRRDRLSVCLTFDDGYFDFYHVVFPLLQKHSLRVLLAISPGLVPERSTRSAAERLRLPAGEDYPHRSPDGFATWSELRELARSGRVKFAAHGLTHAALDDPAADLRREVLQSGLILEEKLETPVDSFVYPYGRFSRTAHALVRENYRYAFRIGHAGNFDWNAPLLYRISADNLPTPAAPFARSSRRRYFCRALWNRLRAR